MPARYQPRPEESLRAAEAMHWSGRSVRQHLATMERHLQAAEKVARAAMTSAEKLHHAEAAAGLWGEIL